MNLSSVTMHLTGWTLCLWILGGHGEANAICLHEIEAMLGVSSPS